MKKKNLVWPYDKPHMELTLGLVSKTIKFPFEYWPSFSQDEGPLGYFQSCPYGCRYDKDTTDQV